MTKMILSPRVVLPLALLLGIAVMGMRTAVMWDVITSGKLTLNGAQAETSKTDETVMAADTSSKDTAKTSTEAASSDAATPPAPDADASPAELDVLKQLSDRREQLEKRNHDLDMRESLLKVTEQRVDAKIKEMETLRLQLQSMINTANEAQQAQIENLVKIYETMKPDEAARILETLDMPIVLGVIEKMKPKSTAPIMAKMNPEKAKEITTALTKQDQLPQVK